MDTLDWFQIGASGGAIGKLGIGHRLHTDEALATLPDGFLITHPQRCPLAVRALWVSSARFDKVLRRWRRYGHVSHGMELVNHD